MHALVHFILVISFALLTPPVLFAKSKSRSKSRSKSKSSSSSTWLIRGGTITVTPKVKSECLSAPDFSDGPAGCTKTDVSSNTQIAGGITWIATKHFSIDIPIALPFKHQIIGDGSMKGSGSLGEIQQLPFTTFFQYRFLGSRSILRPYVGLGLTYAYFFNPEGNARLTATTNPGGEPTTFKVDSKFLITPEIGARVRLYKRFFLDAFYSQTKFRTRTTLSTGQHIDADLDPIIYGLSVGYKY